MDIQGCVGPNDDDRARTLCIAHGNPDVREVVAFSSSATAVSCKPIDGSMGIEQGRIKSKPWVVEEGPKVQLHGVAQPASSPSCLGRSKLSFTRPTSIGEY